MGVGYKGKKAMAMADDVQSYDPFWDRSNSELKYCFVPRECFETKKILWLTDAYRCRRILRGPAGDDPIIEDRWLSKEEYLFGLLNGKYVKS